ncbi:MAG: hypothetical protein H0W68_05395 [Gemmatimonadaceae bacterium]|nr:hypothetical protein [Gemmatimonadaceae bacterium]
MPDTTQPRTFRDSQGLDWTIHEISQPSLAGAMAKVLQSDRRRSGWLVFESSTGDKRRLSPYPPDWRTTSDFEIERWCMRAIEVPPAPARRKED